MTPGLRHASTTTYSRSRSSLAPRLRNRRQAPAHCPTSLNLSAAFVETLHLMMRLPDESAAHDQAYDGARARDDGGARDQLRRRRSRSRDRRRHGAADAAKDAAGAAKDAAAKAADAVKK